MANQHTMPTHAPRVMGTRHMAASANYLAAQAAFEILEAGGNAVDAGVAGGIALGVLQCEYVHFAGVAPIMIHMKETGQTVSISGLGPWPKLASAAWFRENQNGRILSNIKRTVVPAAPDSWITALERFGTMSFAQVAAAAIRFGREGFAVQSISNEIIAGAADTLRQWPQNAAIYLPNDAAPVPGTRFFQTDLAHSIQYMADQESACKGDRLAGMNAARAAFYQGDIAQKIVAYHKENDGWLREDDLSGFRVDVETPLSVRFADTTVFGCGPWCQGPVLLQTLRILDGIDLRGLGHNTPAYIHTLIEALKLAFADRHTYYGDPKFVDVPMEALLSDSYTARRRGLIDPLKACPDMPQAGSPAELGLRARAAVIAKPDAVYAEPEPDTSYVCVIDRWGNAFSATPSDGAINGPVIPGTGIAPSSRGMQSWTDPAHPACLAPGKRPRLTPNPSFAIGDSGWIMPFGSPGNDVQPQAMLQVFLNRVVFGMTPQAAIEQPRFASSSFPSSSDPHNYTPGRMTLERRFDDDTAAALDRLGHGVNWWRDWEYKAGCVCAVVKDTATGMLEGGADVPPPRRGAGLVANRMVRRTRKPKVITDLGGDFGLAKIGAARFDLRDPYHIAVSLSWPAFVAALLLLWLAINLFFASLYILDPGGVANARPGSFSDVFFFSVETLATVGYGVMAPTTPYCHVVSAAEIVSGTAFTAIVTGLLFVRFSRPRARIIFADDAVVTVHNGQPTLMVRLVNGRTAPMTNATARVFVLLSEVTAEGVFFRRVHDLALAQSQLPLFIMPWTVMHPIDVASPLHGRHTAALAQQDTRLFVTIEARDRVLAAVVGDMKTYEPAQIRFGMRYADAVVLHEDGRATADLSRISLLLPDGSGTVA